MDIWKTMCGTLWYSLAPDIPAAGAVTQHTTACCSIQVVDMIFVKGLLHKLPYPSEWYNRNIAGHNTPYFITNIALTSWYSHRSYENTLRYYLSTITTHNKYKELNNLFR